MDYPIAFGFIVVTIALLILGAVLAIITLTSSPNEENVLGLSLVTKDNVGQGDQVWPVWDPADRKYYWYVRRPDTEVTLRADENSDDVSLPTSHSLADDLVLMMWLGAGGGTTQLYSYLHDTRDDTERLQGRTTLLPSTPSDVTFYNLKVIPRDTQVDCLLVMSRGSNVVTLTTYVYDVPSQKWEQKGTTDITVLDATYPPVTSEWENNKLTIFYNAAPGKVVHSEVTISADLSTITPSSASDVFTASEVFTGAYLGNSLFMLATRDTTKKITLTLAEGKTVKANQAYTLTVADDRTFNLTSWEYRQMGVTSHEVVFPVLHDFASLSGTYLNYWVISYTASSLSRKVVLPETIPRLQVSSYNTFTPLDPDHLVQFVVASDWTYYRVYEPTTSTLPTYYTALGGPAEVAYNEQQFAFSNRNNSLIIQNWTPLGIAQLTFQSLITADVPNTLSITAINVPEVFLYESQEPPSLPVEAGKLRYANMNGSVGASFGNSVIAFNRGKFW